MLESETLSQYSRFTSTVRKNGDVWFVHIPKDLAGAWKLEKNAPIELVIARTYPAPEKKK